jgi:hypothetical protein
MGRWLRVAGALGVACVLAVWAAAPASASVGPPSCADVSASTQENQSVTVSFSCTGLISSYSIIGSPSHGSLATIDQSAGTVTYTPDSGHVGSDSFTYEACNNQFQPPCSQATANITIVPPPSCSNVSASTAPNQAVTVFFSCTGSPSSYVIDTRPLHGTLGQIDPINGSVVYTPDAGYTGPDSFT